MTALLLSFLSTLIVSLQTLRRIRNRRHFRSKRAIFRYSSILQRLTLPRKIDKNSVKRSVRMWATNFDKNFYFESNKVSIFKESLKTKIPKRNSDSRVSRFSLQIFLLSSYPTDTTDIFHQINPNHFIWLKQTNFWRTSVPSNLIILKETFQVFQNMEKL